MIDSLAPGSEAGTASESVQPVSKEVTSTHPETQTGFAEIQHQSTREAAPIVEEDKSSEIARLEEKLKAQAVPPVVVDKPASDRPEEVVLSSVAAETGSPKVSELTDGLTSLQRARREALFQRHGGAQAA
jgi:hypothetical protein